MHIALVLSDHKREPCDLCREIAQLDAPEIGEWKLGTQVRFTAPFVFVIFYVTYARASERVQPLRINSSTASGT